MYGNKEISYMRTRILTFLAVLALGAVICLPGMATADMVAVGDPTIVGSWAQEFQVHSVGFFDTVGIFMTSTDSDFLDPGFLSFSAAGWKSSYNFLHPDEALATGAPVDILNFAVHFSGEPITPLSFDVKAWSEGVSGTLKEFAHLHWASPTWTITYEHPDPHCVALVPLPGGLVLLGAGLVRLVTYGRRKRTRA
jgi:hypothetical protein